MKLLWLSIVFLGAGLMGGAVKPMEIIEIGNELTPACGVGYEAGELNELGLAIKGKNLKALQFILEKNQALCYTEIKEASGMFAMEYAFFLHGGDEAFITQIVQVLLAAGVNPNDYKNFSALHYAAGYGYLDLFNQLLKAGADIHALTADGASVAHCAAGMYQDMQHMQPVSNMNVRRLSQGSPIHPRDRKISLELDEKEGEGNILKLVQNVAASKNSLLSKLEILKIFFIDKNCACIQDKCGQLPQFYAKDLALSRFLDGIVGSADQDLLLYEQIKCESTGELISPRTPRSHGQSKLRFSDPFNN